MTSGDSERLRVFSRRAFLVGGMQSTLLAVLLGRLYYLQVLEADNYRTMAEENRINLRLVPPRRGQILDRNGVVLANNQQSYRVVLLPEQMDDLDVTLARLKPYLEITDYERRRVERNLNNETNFNAVPIKDNLTWEQVAALSVHSTELPGIDIDTGEVRSYPFGEITSHVLGYIGTVSAIELNSDDEDESDNLLSIPDFRVGKIGIEKECDLDLRGEAGDQQMEVNAHGQVVRELSHHDAKAGKDVVLTLDIGMQQFVQKLLAKEQGAAAVLMDVDTGGVLALASHPGFDPNLFTYGISEEDWKTLNADEHAPMLNKVTSGVYAPGSTFKPMVALAGLEAGIIDANSRVSCPGYYEFGGTKFHCWKRTGHGSVNLEEAIAGSCDTYFYDLAHKVGIDRIQSMAKHFGFGQKLGIDLPHERAGVVPGRAWKLATEGHLWQQGETLNTAIGQGSVQATPLQLAAMVSRIANGGKAVTPHLVSSMSGRDITPPAPSNLGIDPRHLALIRAGMSAVVNLPIGTAFAARIQEPGMGMAGKTGTAQVRHIGEAERAEGVTANEDLPWKQRDHALFCGFAPLVSPRYAVAVLIEHGGSGAHIAAPLAHDILLEVQTRAKAPK